MYQVVWENYGVDDWRSIMPEEISCKSDVPVLLAVNINMKLQSCLSVGCQRLQIWTTTGWPRPGLMMWACLNTPRPFRLTSSTDACWTPWLGLIWNITSMSPKSSTRSACCWASSCYTCSVLRRRWVRNGDFAEAVCDQWSCGLWKKYLSNFFQALQARRAQCEHQNVDPLVWTSHRVMKWIRDIDLKVGQTREGLKFYKNEKINLFLIYKIWRTTLKWLSLRIVLDPC